MEQFHYAQTSRTAHVNLTTREVMIEDYGRYIEDYFDGSGLVIKILYDELKDGTKPPDRSAQQPSKNRRNIIARYKLFSVLSKMCKCQIDRLNV